MQARLGGELTNNVREELRASLRNLEWNVRYNKAEAAERRRMIKAKVDMILKAASRKGLTSEMVKAKFTIPVLRQATEEELKAYGNRLGASTPRGGQRALEQVLKQIAFEVGGKSHALEEPGVAR
jgi:hypothetical protein